MSFEKKTLGKATRPIFIPDREKPGVRTLDITFNWHMGMSPAVKKRSIISLHQSAKEKGFANILEASSKSDNHIGIKLSAFFLKDEQRYSVENLFQSSKKFELGGPFNLLNVSPRDAKTDPRLRNSGNLIEFIWEDRSFPLEPKSLFYDWLYIRTLDQLHNCDLRDALIRSNFDGFSDIEFNPKKSFSCQARTLALYVSLFINESVAEFIKRPVETVTKYNLYDKIEYKIPCDKKKNNGDHETDEQLTLL